MIFNISSTSSAYRSHRNCILYSVSAKRHAEMLLFRFYFVVCRKLRTFATKYINLYIKKLKLRR